VQFNYKQTMQSFLFLPESHRPPQTQYKYITLDSIFELCKRHRISWWLAPVKVPKLCKVWAQGVITQPLPG